MKAAFIERFGGPEVFQYGDLPDPVAGAGEVVIDIAATSIGAMTAAATRDENLVAFWDSDGAGWKILCPYECPARDDSHEATAGKPAKGTHR